MALGPVGAELTWLYDHGEVLARQDREECVILTVRLREKDASRMRHRMAEPL